MLLSWKFRFIGRRPEYEEVRNFVLSRMPRGGVAAEIGVDQGFFSSAILAIAKPKLLYLIDPWHRPPQTLSGREAGKSQKSVIKT